MFVLIFTLLLLLVGLGTSIYYEEIPIPKPLLRLVESFLQDQGLSLEYDNISLDLRGNLLIEDARASFTQSSELALQVESLYLDINYAALLIGRAPLDKLRLANARLFSPAIISPSGTNDLLLNKVNLELTKHWRKWKLQFFSAEFEELQISANGDLTALIAQLSKPKKKEEQQPELYQQYLNLTRLLADYSIHLHSLENPWLSLSFESPTESDFEVATTFLVDKFALEGLPVIQDLRQNARVQIVPDLRLMERLHISAQLVEMESPKASAANVHLTIHTDKLLENLDTIFPIKAQLTTGQISVQGTLVDQVTFNGRLLSREDIEGTLMTALYSGVVQADLAGNWKQRKATASISGSINAEKIFERPEFDHLWKLRWSKQHKPLYLDVKATYPGSLEDIEASFRLETRDIDIIKAPFQWARLRGTLDGSKVNVPRLEGGGYGNDLICTFTQDLKKPFYRFTMDGLFRPHDIDAWWRDWWKNTFDYLDIKGELPYMNLSIRNAFIYKKQLTLFGYAKAENVSIKGMHFDQASAKMFIRPNYIDAIELNLVRPEGKAEGQFQRQLVNSELKNVMVDIKSNIDLEPSMELFGESGRRIIEPYTWDGNPTITLLGEFNFENDTNWQDLLFKIDTEKPMTLYNFPFDNLHVDGHYDHGDVLLHEVDFGFAGGKGQGEASFLRQDQQSFLLFDLAITDADLDESLQRIATVREPSPGNDDKSATEPKKSSKLEGNLKLHASGISPAGYGLDRVMAKGNIEITDGNLAQIPLFGPLSNLIPFTKLSLTEAKTYFAWDNGKMSFPDLVMKGPTARLEGIGDYFTASSTLDFQVRVYLLRETDIPLVSDIIMPIFDPFSQFASVDLEGTLEKPKWSFTMNPLNLFENKSAPKQLEDPDPLLEFEFRK